MRLVSNYVEDSSLHLKMNVFQESLDQVGVSCRKLGDVPIMFWYRIGPFLSLSAITGHIAISISLTSDQTQG